MRLLALIALLAALVAGVLIYGDSKRVALAARALTDYAQAQFGTGVRLVEVPRGRGGDFTLRAKINGIHAPMVIDTGATSVVLTHETARAIGLPLEMLTYNVEVETAAGRTRAAPVTLDRLGVGGLVERSVPALVVPAGQMKANLLGMSFLDRLESWEVRPDRLELRGYP